MATNKQNDASSAPVERRVRLILQLTLKKQWFDLIADGKKIFEYREYKPHWIRRLLDKTGTRNFDEVRFTNGYGKNKPYVRSEFIGIAIIDGEYCEPENDEPLVQGKKYFVIGLGKVLEVGNT